MMYKSECSVCSCTFYSIKKDVTKCIDCSTPDNLVRLTDEDISKLAPNTPFKRGY